MSVSLVVYATDEQIAERAAGDYVPLCPKWQVRAAGTDGAFAANARWRLTAASVADWAARGIAAGDVVHLSAPRTRFAGEGWLYAVDAVNGANLDLRAIGLKTGEGEPPGIAAGLAGVAFSVPTFQPQRENAARDLNQAFGVDANVAGRTPADAYDPNGDLALFTVLTVLAWMYQSTVRAERGDWALKAKGYKNALAELEARMAVKWGPSGTDQPPSNMFSTRVYR